MYVIAKDKPFYCALILLNLFMWYPIKSGVIYDKVFFGLSALLRLISVISGLGTLAHLVLVLKDDIDIDINEDLGDLAGFIGGMITCLGFLFSHSKWSNFFNNLVNFKRFGQPPKFHEIVKKGNIITLICILYSIPGMLWYCYDSYMQVPECKENNIKKGLHEPCGMVNPTWLPKKQAEGVPFLLWYLFQVTGIFIYLPSAFAICIIPWEAAEVIIARINHLKDLLKDVFESEEQEICAKRLRFCITCHQEIIELSEELGILVKSTLGSTFFTAAVVIGALGSQLIKQSSLKALSFVMGYVTAMFFICHAGQRLVDEGLELASYIYDSRWDEMHPKIRKDVVFVLSRCQKPIALVMPPPLAYASYVLFGWMMKTSYSYLTLLNQMME